MPNKPRLPTPIRRLPKGTGRDDYAPEVLEEYDRNRRRRNTRKYRSRQRHLKGVRDVSFALTKEARLALKALSANCKTSQTKFLNQLLLETHKCLLESPTGLPPIE